MTGEFLHFEGLPPVDAALWRRAVKDPRSVTADERSGLPDYFRGVLDRRLYNMRLRELFDLAIINPAAITDEEFQSLHRDDQKLLLGHQRDYRKDAQALLDEWRRKKGAA